MQPLDLDPNRSAEALAADITAYVHEATRYLAAGEIVALSDLDGAVEVLCQRVMNQRAEEMQHFVPMLDDLRNQLDALQENMRQTQQRIRAELEATNKRQKASRAYRNPEGKH